MEFSSVVYSQNRSASSLGSKTSGAFTSKLPAEKTLVKKIQICLILKWRAIIYWMYPGYL